jgi:hypothetical protein
MNSIPVHKPLWFDDVATSAMGEAFDGACRSLGSFASAVPEIIANRIIAASQVGEREAARLYEQALKDLDIEDACIPVFSVVRDVPVPGSVPDYALIACNA